METQYLKWSGKKAPPAVGDSVSVNFNRLGTGTVTGYFAEAGYLGVTVKLDSPPDWWLNQNGPDREAHLFGAELDRFAPKEA